MSRVVPVSEYGVRVWAGGSLPFGPVPYFLCPAPSAWDWERLACISKRRGTEGAGSQSNLNISEVGGI